VLNAIVNNNDFHTLTLTRSFVQQQQQQGSSDNKKHEEDIKHEDPVNDRKNALFLWLFFLCANLTTDEHKKKIVCHDMRCMFTAFPKKKQNNCRFNLLLWCFVFVSSSDYRTSQHHYTYNNMYYVPLVLECAVKFDYIFVEKQKQYPKLTMEEAEVEHDTSPPHIYKTYLFSKPSICMREEDTSSSSRSRRRPTEYEHSSKPTNKIIYISKVKEKIKYNIKKTE
jgi:hypothetical protein